MKKETIVRNTMREFKEGKLHSSSGEKVTERDQAIAIALSKSNQTKFEQGGYIVQYDSDKKKAGMSSKKEAEDFAEFLKEKGHSLIKIFRMDSDGNPLKTSKKSNASQAVNLNEIEKPSDKKEFLEAASNYFISKGFVFEMTPDERRYVIGLIENIDTKNRTKIENEAIKYFIENEMIKKLQGDKRVYVEKLIENAITKRNKFAAGGMVGQNLVFDRWDEKLEGRIIEITDSGDYIVSSGSRTILVSPDDIISYGDIKPKKRFTFFKDGGTTSSETILWAVKVGEPDWKEVLITNNPDKIDEARKWASENGFDRFRVASMDMSSRPDFTKTFKDGGDVMKYDWASMWKKPSKSSRVMIGDIVFQKHSDQPYKIIELLDDQYTVAKIVNNEETEWKTFNKDFYEHRMFEKRN